MISSSTSIPASTPDKKISKLMFILLCVLFVIFLIVGLGFIYQGCRYNAMKKRGVYEKLKSYGTV